MKASAKKLANFVFLLFTFAIVLWIGLKDNDISELGQALASFSPTWLGVCLLCWLGYLVTDALSLHYYLKKQGQRIHFLRTLYVALTGLYYCNVTPGATGGQPMQIYRLKQADVPIGISSSAMTVRFFCFQTMLLIVGAFLWILNGHFVQVQLSSTPWFVIAGYVVNFFSIGLVLAMSISRRLVHTAIVLCVRLGTKLHICKNPEHSLSKWEAHMTSFLASVDLIRRRPKELLIQCLLATVQLFFLMSVIPAIYAAFGLKSASLIELYTMGVLLYISASYTPLPGASGAQEGGFALYFRGIFPDASLFVALLVWRFFTYYLSVLCGVVMTVMENIPPPLRHSENAEHAGR